MNQYSDEETADITNRVNQATEFLKELNLIPSAIVSKVALSEDTFADKVQAYLRDTKYDKSIKESPESLS